MMIRVEHRFQNKEEGSRGNIIVQRTRTVPAVLQIQMSHVFLVPYTEGQRRNILRLSNE